MLASELIHQLQSGKLNESLNTLYGQDALPFQMNRYRSLLNNFIEIFEDKSCSVFSSPGRSEVGGNHTDHQHGRVLACSVDLDAIAAVTPHDSLVLIHSEGFEIAPINIHDLGMRAEEKNTSESLIRGVLSRFVELGYKIGGFSAVITSSVLKGSGISSSAAFEVLIGTILSHLYNANQVDAIEIAKISQYAENVYFGKPSGLMDQMACSVGSFVYIDFKDITNPVVKKVQVDFKESGYHLCLIDTKGSHADLSDEYGLMPQEMKEVAQVFGKDFLSEVSFEEFFAQLPEVRKYCNDRAILRAFHFFNDDARVVQEVQALQAGNINEFLALVIESGRSSYMYLQNVFSVRNVREQGLSLALAVSEELLEGRGGWRVHGGGLAGTIQAFVPHDLLESYRNKMESLFGQGSCYVLNIRSEGGCKVI